MPHSKTPGQSNAASDKFNKAQAEAKGLGASNAPAAKELSKPGEAPVASDSGNSNVGVDPSANKPGEEGIGGPNYGSR
ncbi:hypothetical protein C7974DRAFT_411219 [Boeremia exigua]|uniref:uncharacterized protein n=1 Tax=Boeremia exigua TaxID=749465 RepID=UPI001E8E8D3F|nr:uncharacterized protein C7974DRAFT_411219 [Boeremia exigua]KAH6637754.1 hypothetical protein C7974DRAFT_411219 [Boeremia exigua]